MEAGLSESDQALAWDLAHDPIFVAGVSRLGPVSNNLLALCEAYIGFLRYAPSLNPPPVLWALAIVHRHTAELYTRFSLSSPELADRLERSFDQQTPFFSGNYPEVRIHCLDKMQFPDDTIWPIKAESFKQPNIVLWAAILTLVFVLSVATMPPTWTLYVVSILAIVAVGAIVIGLCRDLLRMSHRTTLLRTPDVLRTALFHARKARCAKEMSLAHIRTERLFKVVFIFDFILSGPFSIVISLLILVATSFLHVFFKKEE